MKKLIVIVSMLFAVAVAVAIAAPGPPAAAASAAEQGAATVILHVEGMTCASCSVTVGVTLKRLDGVKDAVVQVKEKRARVTYDPALVTPKRLVEAVNKSGYTARIAADQGG